MTTGALTLTLEQALRLANNEAAIPSVRIVGALSVASILLHQHQDNIDPTFDETLHALADNIKGLLP